MIAALGLALWGSTRIWSGRGIGSGLMLLAAAGVCAGTVDRLQVQRPARADDHRRLVRARPARVAAGRSGRRRHRRRGGPVDRDDVDDRSRAQPDADLPARGAIIRPESAELAAMRPWGRFRAMVKYRLETSAGQQTDGQVPRDVVRRPPTRLGGIRRPGLRPVQPVRSAAGRTPRSATSSGRTGGWSCGGRWSCSACSGRFRLGRDSSATGTPPTAFALLVWAARELGRRRRLSADGVGPISPADPGTERVAGRGRGLGALGSIGPEGGDGVRRIDPPALWVFLILLGSYAFFWHSRDWNTASRLMLTYAMVDRGTVAITGWSSRPATRPGSAASIIPTSCPAIPCWRRCRMPSRSGCSTCRPTRSAKPGIEVLAGGLLDHAGDVGPAHRLDRRPAGAPGPGPGLHAGRLGAAGPGLWPFDSGLRLRHARLRTPGLARSPCSPRSC